MLLDDLVSLLCCNRDTKLFFGVRFLHLLLSWGQLDGNVKLSFSSEDNAHALGFFDASSLSTVSTVFSELVPEFTKLGSNSKVLSLSKEVKVRNCASSSISS